MNWHMKIIAIFKDLKEGALVGKEGTNVRPAVALRASPVGES